METQKPLLKDEDGEEVDAHMYRSMIGSLMYLTSSRPDIMYAVCTCARYQVNLKVSYLHVVKRSFRYLKGQLKLGLWYPKDSPFDLVAYIDSDYAGGSLDRKSTTGGKAKKGVRLMMEKLFGMEFELILAKTINGEVQLHALVDGKKIIITESIVRMDLQLEDAEGGGPRCQETIGDAIAQTRFKNVSKLFNDPLLAKGGGNITSKWWDGLKLRNLWNMYQVTTRVLDLGEDKEPRLHKVGMSRRVESSGDEKDLGEDASKQERRINAIDADEEITLKQEVATKGVNFRLLMKYIGSSTFDADYQLAERLQAAKQEQFTIEEKATLFKELLEQRRKNFVAKRAEEKRNKPPTKRQ
ncbi:hypothetical protein Tco_0467965 [Tanacetum coccineum]